MIALPPHFFLPLFPAPTFSDGCRVALPELLHLTPVPACEARRRLSVFVDVKLERGSNLPLRQGGEGGLLVFLLQIHFQKTPAEMLHCIPTD